jgi:hypothetical protein
VRYFDAFVYLANWGTRRLMLKLPRAVVEPEDLSPYAVDQTLSIEVGRDHVLLEFLCDDEETSDWIEDQEAEAWMPSLAPLRAEVVRGDLTALYLAWLHGAATDPDMADEATEPAVPAGLRKLSAPCRVLCDFLGIDQELVAAAAERSPVAPQADLSPEALRASVKALSVAQKDDWIVRLATGSGAGVEAEITRHLRRAHASPGTREEQPKPRTAAELCARAEALKEARAAREARAAEEARKKRARIEAAAKERRLIELEGNEGKTWRQIEELVTQKKQNTYARAADLLVDLRALAERQGDVAAFEARLAKLRAVHGQKHALIRRLREKGLLAPSIRGDRS